MRLSYLTNHFRKPSQIAPPKLLAPRFAALQRKILQFQQDLRTRKVLSLQDEQTLTGITLFLAQMRPILVRHDKLMDDILKFFRINYNTRAVELLEGRALSNGLPDETSEETPTENPLNEERTDV